MYAKLLSLKMLNCQRAFKNGGLLKLKPQSVLLNNKPRQQEAEKMPERSTEFVGKNIMLVFFGANQNQTALLSAYCIP